MKKDNIKVIIKIKDGFVSTNELYAARVNYSGGRPHAQVYKTPRAVAADRVIKDQLRAVDWTDYIDFLCNT